MCFSSQSRSLKRDGRRDCRSRAAAQFRDYPPYSLPGAHRAGFSFSRTPMKRDAFTLPLEQTVAVLFARADSTYKTLPGTDVWDIERNAKLWPGGAPVVAHPPCRAWGAFECSQSRARTRDCWPHGAFARCEGLAACSNTQSAHFSGRRPACPPLGRSMHMAAGRCPSIRTGGDTEQRKPRCFTSSAAHHPMCHRFLCGWARRPT